MGTGFHRQFLEMALVSDQLPGMSRALRRQARD
jgi:hypothetical protein